MPDSDSSQPYLLVCKSHEDVLKIDEAREKGELRCLKLGESVYLAFLHHMPQEIDRMWRKKFDLSDELHWIILPAAVVTRT